MRRPATRIHAAPGGPSGARAGGGTGSSPPGADPAAASRAALVLWSALALLSLSRAALAFEPGMWAWGANLPRFLPPWIAWGPWWVAGLALIPALWNRGSPRAARPPKPGRVMPALAFLACGAGGAAVVLALPDQLYFMGDFLLRRGAALGQRDPTRDFPQATRLDVLLHYDLPRTLDRTMGLDPAFESILLGCLEAALLAMLALAFTRALKLRNGAALAAGSIVFFGGYLALLTGYGKSFSELVILTAAVGVFSVQVALDGPGLVPMGLAVSLAIALHRSGLALLLPAAGAWWVWLRGHGRAGGWRRPAPILSMGLPALAALALMAPAILRAVRMMDRDHFVPAAGAGIFSSLNPVHLADVANALFLLSPLALAAPLLAIPLYGSLKGRKDAWLLGLLLLPFLAMMLLLHPRQGVFRDWDVFASAGVACSLAAAWLVGETLRAAPGRRWLAVAAALGVACPGVQWLAHNHDPDRGASRVAAYLSGPPPRPSPETALSWDFLGLRDMSLGRFAASALSLSHAAESAPSTRILFSWAVAEARAGNKAKAQEVLKRLVARSPQVLEAWRLLAMVSAQLGDVPTARGAAEEVLRAAPDDPQALGVLRWSRQTRNPLR